MLYTFLLDNLHFLNFVWIAISAIGLLFAVFAVHESLKDRLALRVLDIHDARSYLCKILLIKEWSRFTIQVTFLIIAFLVLLIPPRTNVTEKVHLIQVIIRYGFIFSSGLSGFNSYLTLKSRLKLIGKLWR